MSTFKNGPVSIEDIHKTKKIYGCNVPTLKGKTVCQQPGHVQTEYIEVLKSLRERIGKLMVTADIMFVNNIPFVVSVLRGVNLTMVE